MIEYDEECLLKLVFLVRGSVAPRAFLFAFPSAFIAWAILAADDFIPGWRESVGFDDLNQVSVLWGASTAVLVILLGFRTNRAMARFWEGTGLLHQMRGEWFDSVSCCVTFSRGALRDKPVEVMEFRHTIVRLMSLCHGSALEEISFSEAEDLETIDSLGLDNVTLQHLNDCKRLFNFNRVEVLLHLIQSLITENLDRGILKVAPPILSRVYQTLSRGFVNFLNAKKIADTRFPFPYAQTIAALSILQTVLTPVMIASIVSNRIWAPIFSFVPIFGIFSLNFIGVELENPFGDDANDLPLDHFQTEMNRCLLMLLQESADLMPQTHETRCIKDFSQLFASVAGAQVGVQPPGKDGEPPTHSRSHCRISELFIEGVDFMGANVAGPGANNAARDRGAEAALDAAVAAPPATWMTENSFPARSNTETSNFSEKTPPPVPAAAAVAAAAAAAAVSPALVAVERHAESCRRGLSSDTRQSNEKTIDSLSLSVLDIRVRGSPTAEQDVPTTPPLTPNGIDLKGKDLFKNGVPFSTRQYSAPRGAVLGRADANDTPEALELREENRLLRAQLAARGGPLPREACAQQVATMPAAHLLPAVVQAWTAGVGNRAESTELLRLREPPDKGLEESVERFSAALQELRDLVDNKLLREFGRTSSALRSFSDALPGLLPTSLQPPPYASHLAAAALRSFSEPPAAASQPQSPAIADGAHARVPPVPAPSSKDVEVSSSGAVWMKTRASALSPSVPWSSRSQGGTGLATVDTRTGRPRGGTRV